MRRLVVTLGLLLIVSLPARAGGNSVIAVSVYPAVVHATLGQPVYLTVSVTNTSSTPRYVGRDVIGGLEYAVKSYSGHVLRGLSDPPAPSPAPYDDEDLVWLEPGQAISFNQRLALDSLGITSAGQFHVVAFLSGTVATEAEWQANKYGSFFSFAPEVTVFVQGSRRGAQPKKG